MGSYRFKTPDGSSPEKECFVLASELRGHSPLKDPGCRNLPKGLMMWVLLCIP